VRQHRLHQIFYQIKSVDTQLKTCMAESLREPLMKIVQNLLISDKATFEQLTTPEQNLWTRFETKDIYRFLNGELDTIPEFQYNWTSIPRLKLLGPMLGAPPPTAAAQAPPAPVAPLTPPPAPAPLLDTSSSVSSSSSSPNSSPTPSTSGKRPKQSQLTTTKSTTPDPSGASTSGTTPLASTSTNLNLRPRT
jgi:hypothetical protein